MDRNLIREFAQRLVNIDLNISKKQMVMGALCIVYIVSVIVVAVYWYITKKNVGQDSDTRLITGTTSQKSTVSQPEFTQNDRAVLELLTDLDKLDRAIMGR
jgi:hypothetical protein